MFPFETTKFVIEVDVEVEEVEEGAVVEAPAVVTGGTSGVFRMSQNDDGETTEDKITAAAAAEARLGGPEK